MEAHRGGFSSSHNLFDENEDLGLRIFFQGITLCRDRDLMEEILEMKIELVEDYMKKAEQIYFVRNSGKGEELLVFALIFFTTIIQAIYTPEQAKIYIYILTSK